MKKSFLISFFLLLLTLASCSKEELYAPQQHYSMGRINLCLQDDIVCIEELTKAGTEIALDDIKFKIKGQTLGGSSVDEEITFIGSFGSAYAYFKAGIYAISATYEPEESNEGLGYACFSGETEEFRLDAAGVTENLEITMTPSNAKVSVVFQGLTEFYETASVVFSSPREGVRINLNDTSYDAFFPAGSTVEYTISAKALSNSGATDVNSIAGKRITLEAGKSYTITISATPGGLEILAGGPGDDPSPEVWDEEFS